MIDPPASNMPKASAVLGSIRPAGSGRSVAFHLGVEVALIPHVNRTGSTGRDCDTKDRDGGNNRMNAAGRNDYAANPVNTTRDITRGFRSAMKSNTAASRGSGTGLRRLSH